MPVDLEMHKYLYLYSLHCRASFFVFYRTNSQICYLKNIIVKTNSTKRWKTGWVGAGILSSCWMQQEDDYLQWDYLCFSLLWFSEFMKRLGWRRLVLSFASSRRGNVCWTSYLLLFLCPQAPAEINRTGVVMWAVILFQPWLYVSLLHTVSGASRFLLWAVD